LLTRGTKTCPTSCPNGEAKDLTKSDTNAQYCLVCHATCLRCAESNESAEWVGLDSKCTLCDYANNNKKLQNYMLNSAPTNPTASYCVICNDITTDGGWYASTSHDLCQPCDSSCSHCVGPNANQCTSCTSSTHRIIRGAPTDTYGTCQVCEDYTTTEPGYYTGTDANFCMPCHASCGRCKNPGTITDCVKCLTTESG